MPHWIDFFLTTDGSYLQERLGNLESNIFNVFNVTQFLPERMDDEMGIGTAGKSQVGLPTSQVEVPGFK